MVSEPDVSHANAYAFYNIWIYVTVSYANPVWLKDK